MPLPVPNLDDRTFDQLVTEGRSLIPRYTQEWTNHNPSDPGITLLELFAYLTEAAIFQLNQVPEASVERFLALVGEPRALANGGKEPVADTIRRMLEGVDVRLRAVTEEDFATMAQQLHTGVARAELLVVSDPICSHPDPHPGEPAPVGILLVVPRDPELEERDSDTPAVRRSRRRRRQRLVASLHRSFRHRLVLTTRLHVAVAESVEIVVEAEIARRQSSGLSAQQVETAIERFLDRLQGGPAGDGWPFGRAVYRSELFQLLEGIPEVDHVESLAIRRAADAPSPEDAERERISLEPTQLVRAPRENIRVTIRDLT